MSSNRSFSGWRSWRVGARLAIIPALFIAALVANLGYAVNTLRGNEVDALLVQVSTRQEAAAEQYVKEVLLASQGFPSGHVETLARLVETAERLESGGSVLIDEKVGRRTKLPPAPNAAIAGMAGEQKQLSETLGKCGEALLATPRSSPAYAARLNELLAAGLQVDLNIHHGEELFEQTAESRVEGMIWTEVIIAVIVTLVGIAVSTVLARGITRPLGQVVRVADEISQGNLRQLKIEVQSGDEIGDLASVFNSMLDNLRQLAGRNRASAESVNAATAQILSFTQQQAAGAAEQAAAVQQTTATLEEIRQSGAQIADKARQVAASSEATSTTSQAGLHAIQQMARSMEGIREQAEAVAGNIVVLSEKTQAVGEIVATVNDIAEQSNLLALNAAIEAAAAGEHGRSFAVVASEMKNLAQQSREATVQVRSILGDIQKGINTSVMLTEEAVKRVETGRQQVDVAGQTIREMAESIIQSVQAFQQIVAATSQQQIGYEQVTQAVQNIRIAAEQAAAGTRQLESAAAGLTALAQELRRSMESYQL